MGDRAFDAGAAVKWALLKGSVEVALDAYADAAELDRVHVRAWAHVHALQGAYWGRRFGFAGEWHRQRVDELAARLAGR